jgi:hypothetical protein
MEKKIAYVPPTVEIDRVAIEVAIVASPVKHIELKDWDDNNNLNDPQNNADVWLNM